jgi:hypothetical protein
MAPSGDFAGAPGSGGCSTRRTGPVLAAAPATDAIWPALSE